MADGHDVFRASVTLTGAQLQLIVAAGPHGRREVGGSVLKLNRWKKRRWARLALLPTMLMMLGAAQQPADEAATPPAGSAASAPAIKSAFWEVTQTGDKRPPLPESKFCSGGQMQDLIVKMGEAIKKAGLQDCTHTSSKNADGSVLLDMSCKMKLGDKLTSYTHMTLTGTSRDVHQHMESRMEGLGPPFDKSHFTDSHFVYLGDCPANVKPGQFLTPEGEIYDPVEALKNLGKKDKVAAAEPTPPIAPPPVIPVAESAVSARGTLQIVCSPSGKWGNLRLGETVYPFGGPKQRWRVRPDIGASILGEHLLIWAVDGDGVDLADFDTEPNYTVRLGRSYAFTPPIAQHASVTVHGDSLFSAKARAKENARKAAEARGDDFCYLQSCFTSDAENDAFFKALDRTAAEGGDLTISATGPGGPVTMRYSLRGLSGIIGQLEKCTKSQK